MRVIRTMAAGAGALMMTVGGCSRSLVADHMEETISSRTEGSDQEFWHRLPGRPAVTNSEGLHGVLLLSDGEDPTSGWEERLALLHERGWLPEGFNEPGNQTIERGTLAKALCHAMDIDGGVMMRLSHKHPRYAIRELAYLRIMGSSTENQIISGLDYIGVMSKAQDHMMLQEQKRAKRSAPPASTPAEQPSGSGAGGEPSF